MALKPVSSLNLCFIFLFFPLIQANTSSASNETDLLSLIAIKDRIEGLGSWNRSLHFCQWQGITCGKRHRRVMGLNLGNQNLVGSIAPHIGNLSFLRLVNLSRNKLYGEIPQEFGQLRRLKGLAMWGNVFEGNIPANIGSLYKLQYLDLHKNRLTGQIPHSLGNLSSLQIFDLGYNILEESIPDTLGRLSGLILFSVEINRLSGEVSMSSLTGNPKLCGGIHELQLDTCHTKHAKEEESSVAFKLAIVIALSMFLLLASFFLFFYFKRKRQGESSSTSFTGQNFMVSYRTLYRATDGFSATNLVGSGSYGHVYKGMLNQDEMVAVKVFNLQQKGATKSFMGECKSLRMIRHRNLNRILTCCASVDHQGNDFKALVFEFMPNGSVEKWLYGDTNREVGQERKLNLFQRLNIAFDVASALTYLHHESHVCIIHRDLKLSNVLLDNDMVAHVSDFGLAKLLSGSLEGSSKTRSSSVPLKGSIGYIAPEYGMGGDASIAGDVYSFGILLLELFIARRPIDSMF